MGRGAVPVGAAPLCCFAPHTPYTNARDCAMIELSSRFAANNRQSIEVYCTMSELLETLRQEGVDPALLSAVEEYRAAHPLDAALRPRIPAPASQLLFRSNEYTFGEISERLGAPFILKIPDGSFSVGKHKVADDAELRAALDEMFGHSAVLLAQEFIPTEFDWRIGLLDGEPLFACKYFMAKGHWQIYNHAHDDTGRNLCGAWETVPIYKAPQKVLDTAVKAAALIGKGLYGVDLKLINGRAVVIEINDNPSIDHEVEDAVLGDELYYRILNHFVHCLNRLHAQ